MDIEVIHLTCFLFRVPENLLHVAPSGWRVFRFPLITLRPTITHQPMLIIDYSQQYLVAAAKRANVLFLADVEGYDPAILGMYVFGVVMISEKKVE